MGQARSSPIFIIELIVRFTQVVPSLQKKIVGLMGHTQVKYILQSIQRRCRVATQPFPRISKMLKRRTSSTAISCSSLCPNNATPQHRNASPTKRWHLPFFPRPQTPERERKRPSAKKKRIALVAPTQQCQPTLGITGGRTQGSGGGFAPRMGHAVELKVGGLIGKRKTPRVGCLSDETHGHLM